MDQAAERIPVYFIPGLGAGIEIFEKIHLPPNKYEIYFIEWLIPESEDEPLSHYVERMAQQVKHKNPVLVGVSFGGIIAQELSKIIPVRKVIIISSIKKRKEMPRRLRLMQRIRLYKLIPDKAFDDFSKFSRYTFGKKVKKKFQLYERYMRVRDRKYLIWAIENLLNWKETAVPENLIHIHGTADTVFPIKNIEHKIEIDGGNHAMILIKSRKISKLLNNLIESGD